MSSVTIDDLIEAIWQILVAASISDDCSPIKPPMPYSNLQIIAHLMA